MRNLKASAFKGRLIFTTKSIALQKGWKSVISYALRNTQTRDTDAIPRKYFPSL